jgi:hypothetical protein
MESKKENCVRFEVFTAVTMKNGVFWDVTPCGCVALVRTDVSEQRSPSIIRVTRIGGLGTKSALTSNRITLRKLEADERCEEVHSYC